MIKNYKILIGLLFCFIFITNYSKANKICNTNTNHTTNSEDTYEPIIDTTKMWVVFRGDGVGIGRSGETLAYKITDSIRLDDGYYWHRILESQDSTYSNWRTNGFIREQNKKAFYRCNNTNSYELTIYDFNKNIGDTLFYGDEILGYFIIDSIKQVEFAGKKRLQQYGHTRRLGETKIIYEGIGSEDGPFQLALFGTATGAYYDLVCYHQNDSLKYLNPEFDCCFLDIPLEKNWIYEQNKIKLFPNPNNGKIHFEIKNSLTSDNMKLIIYNYNGKLVLHKEIENSTFSINVSALKPGHYICHIMSDNSILDTKKFIIKP